MADLASRSAIGHNRYSTTGSSSPVNAQPIVIDFKRGPLAAERPPRPTRLGEREEKP